MTQYRAIINVPGYLPESEDQPVFDTAVEAWLYLVNERGESEDSFPDWNGGEYSDIYSDLASMANGEWSDKLGNLAADGTGTIVGDTPGYDGNHDQGVAYSVEPVTADTEFVSKLAQHTADVHREFGQPVHFGSPDIRAHLTKTMYATPIETNRDADTRVRSNWEVITADLLRDFPDDVEVHRFGHWAVGWLERLYVRQAAEAAIIAVAQWVGKLEDYPVADHSHLSDLEDQEIHGNVGDLAADLFRTTIADPGSLVEFWDDELDHAQREDIVRMILGQDDGDLWPEHDGIDIRWDYDTIETAVTEWLEWATDPDQHPAVMSLRQDQIQGMEE